MAETPTWIITLAGNRPAAEVESALRGAGFVTTSVLSEIGVITGQCAPGRVSALRRIDGVADVAADAPVHVGPPGAPNTW